MRNPTACAEFLSNLFKIVGAALPEKFLRKRGTMSPAAAMWCLLGMTGKGMTCGYKGLLSVVHATRGHRFKWNSLPEESTFGRARAKMTPEMLRKVTEAIHNAFLPKLKAYMPHIQGHRLVAIDGSWITLANAKVLRQAFGVHCIGPQRCRMRRPQLLLIVLTDAVTRMPIARFILPGNGSERAGAKALLSHLQPNDILLADRGYPGRELLNLIHSTGCRYVLRVSSGASAWREFRHLQRHRVSDAKVQIACGNKSLSVRHIRVKSGPGRPRKNTKRETQFLITNLPASWSVKRIASLYKARWGIETFFRELKVTLEGGGLRSRTAEGVVQELDARCIHLTIAAYLDIAACVEADTLQRRATHTPNRSALLIIIQSCILGSDHPDEQERRGHAAMQIARRAQRKRPGRRAERKRAMFAKVR